ncbi:DUF5317 domain-containing protein [Anaerovirgula multivorans]|uniref:DUF5317 domain-containing protein n=1 Tax=Anaerovirgula multivorans TaxID=312168 RepID=UPI00241BF197|nr:DUF5317 domain-containing protein [Anaerovirgula multivorans]
MLEGIILGILVGRFRGGKFKRLGTSLFKFSWIIFLSFALQLGISIMISLGHPFVIQYRMILYVLSYVLLFLALFLNMQFKCMWFIMIGAITNFAAIMLNGGSMPVDMGILERNGFQNMLNSIRMEALPQYIPLEEAGLYTSYLGKRLSMPAMYPLKQIFSVGDLLMVIGIFFLIQNMMTPSIYNRTSKIIRFDHKSRVFK